MSSFRDNRGTWSPWRWACPAPALMGSLAVLVVVGTTGCFPPPPRPACGPSRVWPRLSSPYHPQDFLPGPCSDHQSAIILLFVPLEQQRCAEEQGPGASCAGGGLGTLPSPLSSPRTTLESLGPRRGALSQHKWEVLVRRLPRSVPSRQGSLSGTQILGLLS